MVLEKVKCLLWNCRKSHEEKNVKSIRDVLGLDYETYSTIFQMIHLCVQNYFK